MSFYVKILKAFKEIKKNVKVLFFCYLFLLDRKQPCEGGRVPQIELTLLIKSYYSE